MKYVQKRGWVRVWGCGGEGWLGGRGYTENEIGEERQKERGGKNVSGCASMCVSGGGVIYRDGSKKIERTSRG